jgi:hypothetical protein
MGTSKGNVNRSGHRQIGPGDGQERHVKSPFETGGTSLSPGRRQIQDQQRRLEIEFKRLGGTGYPANDILFPLQDSPQTPGQGLRSGNNQ